MRKDVKLGFAIGGVLFSVLIVYVLVISGGTNDTKPQQVTLVTNETPAKTDKTPAPAAGQQDRARQQNNRRQQNAADATAKPADAKDTKPTKPETTPTDPFKQLAAAPATKPTEAASTADQWAAALQGGAPPTLLNTTTPTAAPTTRAGQAPVAESSVPTPISAANTPTQTKPIMARTESNTPANVVPPNATPVRVSSGNTGPTTRSGTSPVIESAARISPVPTPAAATGRTHVVQAGETFSSIAATAYGNSAYYSHIIRANPTLDPKKLRAGTTINLPPESEVKANNTATPAAAVIGAATPTQSPAVKLDEKTEYRVESGDNLNKISAKLYGAANRWEKIYEANKTLIGADPKNLKVGMVLKLPEAPSIKQQ